MFYAHFVLSKKGPLARIWLAAHWDKKLTKAHVFETNIEGSVEAIIQPKVKLALRTSGHLLLGVVRIYSRKAKYLLADCNEAFVKIKMAFRPGMVDLPEENREAALSAITLAEAFHDFDSTMADLNDIDVHAQFAVNQSRPEEITMREELGNITLVGDDGFGDMGFDGPGSLLHDAHMDDTLYMKDSDHGRFNDGPDDLGFGGHRGDAFSSALDDYDEPAGIDDDDDDNDDGGSFGGDELFGDNFVGESGGLFEDPIAPDFGLSSDGPRPVDPFSTDIDPLAPPMLSTHDEVPRPPVNIFNDFMGTTLPSAPTPMETEPPMLAMDGMNTSGAHEGFRELPPDVPSLSPMRSPLRSPLRSLRGNGGFMMEPPASVPPEIPPNISEFLNDRPPPSVGYPGMADQTTLLADDKEAFALEPIDINTVGAERKIRKKRKLVIDEQKAIASETMKLQLSDSSEIVTTLDLAPPTKKLMHWKETGGVEKLFSFPGRPIVCKRIFKLFNQNLITKSSGDTAAALSPVTPAEPRERVRRAGRSSAAVNQTAVEDSSTAAINGSTLLSADTPAPLDHDDETIAAINDLPLLPLAAQENSLLSDDTTSRLAPPDLTSSDPSFLDPSRTPLPLPRLTSPHPTLPPESDERGLQLPQLTSPHRDPSLNFSAQGHIPPGSPANSLPSLPPYHPVGGGSDDDNDDMGGGYDDDYADDDDDYAGNNQPEPDEYRDEEEDEAIEPIEGEGEEQAEERRWNKRSQQMRSVLSKVLVRQPAVTYREMVSRNSRKQAASKFYTFLVMKKLQAIDIRQDEPYGDITISKGPAFDSVW